MKYIKIYEDFDYEEVKKSINKLHDTLSNIKKHAMMQKKVLTETEEYEDYFLDLKEDYGFNIYIYRGTKNEVWDLIKPINILLKKNCKEDDINIKFFNEILSKLRIAKNRLESDGFNCHFSIMFGGKSQCDWNPKTIKNDDFKFKGIGLERIEGLVPIKIDFYII